LVLLGLISFLFTFSSFKNGVRAISEVEVNFLGDENLFITEEAVNKLLIQNEQGVSSMTKETLDLNGLETALNSSPMIKTAQVYISVNGEVRADVVQRKPIARVSTNASYYIDDTGAFMPLSSNYTARVPLVTGYIEKNNLKGIFKVADLIIKDQFLKKHIIEIEHKADGTITLKTRIWDFKIEIGEVSSLERKFSNLKAFYQKAKKENTLDRYSRVNLEIDNQVVCTKK
jgi:cell division protein FtsQ